MSSVQAGGAQPPASSRRRLFLTLLVVIVGLPVLAITTCTGVVFVAAVGDSLAPTALEARYAFDGDGGGVLLLKNLTEEPLRDVRVRLAWSSGIFKAESSHLVERIDARSTATVPLSIRRVDKENAPRIGDFYSGEQWLDLTRRQQERELLKFGRVQRMYEDKENEGRATAFSSVARIAVTADGSDVKATVKNDSIPLSNEAMIGMDSPRGRYALRLSDVPKDSAAAVLIRMDQENRIVEQRRRAAERERKLSEAAQQLREEAFRSAEDTLSILRSWSTRYPDQEAIMERDVVTAINASCAGHNTRVVELTGFSPTAEEFARHVAPIARDAHQRWKQAVEEVVAGKPIHQVDDQ